LRNQPVHGLARGHDTGTEHGGNGPDGHRLARLEMPVHEGAAHGLRDLLAQRDIGDLFEYRQHMCTAAGPGEMSHGVRKTGMPVLELDLRRALELQDLARLGRARDLKAEAFDDLADLPHL